MGGGHLTEKHMCILKEGHCIAYGLNNFCKNLDIGNRVYEAGSIDTLVRIVDRNGGFTIIPEMHINFLSEKQKGNIAYLNIESQTQRCISIIIKDDFIRERMVNAVLDSFKHIIPAHMMKDWINRKPIKLR